MSRESERDQHSSSRATDQISGRQLAAGRALAGVSAANLAAACGLPVDTLTRLENAGSAWIREEAQVEAVKRGLDHFGVMIVEESDGMGAGVRLKFTRKDVRQITRLEGEGGIVGSDDAP
ncbi:MAG TPA: hypothetical protein VK035_01060 [Kiloniellales bacterium]|nr:hypothetical protein [Kiloniellales bacterium]